MDRHPEEKRAKIKTMKATLLGGIRLLQQLDNRFGYYGGSLRSNRHALLVMIAVPASICSIMGSRLIDRGNKIVGRDDIAQLIVTQADDKLIRGLHVPPKDRLRGNLGMGCRYPFLATAV
jgi:hypothetical protein